MANVDSITLFIYFERLDDNNANMDEDLSWREMGKLTEKTSLWFGRWFEVPAMKKS